jgi:hypothetical protein
VTVAVATLALAAAGAGASKPPGVTVAVTPTIATATAGRAPLGRRQSTVTFRVAVSSDSSCENLSVAYSYRKFFDGRATDSVAESFDTGTTTSTATFDVHTAADAAETVVLRARGTCEQEDGTVLAASSPVVANVAVPAHSCDEGPLHVLALAGSARRALSGALVAVRTGHYLRAGDPVALGARSRLVFGAPECHGLRVVVDGRKKVALVPGDYARGAVGAPTTVGAGAGVRFHGDRDAGGVQTKTAIAVARGSSNVAFRLEALADQVTTVRVLSGSAYVAPRLGPTYGKAVVVRAGRSARCVGGVCAIR